MERGPSRNHGAYTRETSLLIKKNAYASDTRSLRTFLFKTIDLDYQYINRFSEKTLMTPLKAKSFRMPDEARNSKFLVLEKLQKSI